LQQLSFDIDQFNRLFPFFLLFNEAMEVTAHGTSLGKLVEIRQGQSFLELIQVKRPKLEKLDFATLKRNLQEMYFLSLPSGENPVNLRGQFEYLESMHQLLFVGSPWFSSLEEVTDKNYC